MEDFDGHFLFGVETGLFKFDQQGILVDILQETKPQRVVHFVYAILGYALSILSID